MRPIARFALHAAAAIVLAAFATTSAAALLAAFATTSAAAERPTTYLALGDSIPAASGGDRRDHIEILSYSFGDGSAVKLDPVYIKSWSTSGDAGAPPPRAGGRNELTMDDTAGKEQARGGTATVDANEKITVHGGRTEGLIGQAIGNLASEGNEDSARAAGKRTPPAVTLKRGMTRASGGDPDRPVIAGNVPNPASPPAKGSVRVKVKFPWLGCRAGASYPSLELADGGKRYLLQDVTVASCGRSGSGDADDRPTEEVAFYYNKIAFNYASSPAKVQVRGWDPKKKEE